MVDRLCSGFRVITAIFEPCHEKTNILHAKIKTQGGFAVTAKLISAFVYAT